jgi:hypothetical protein
LVSAASDECRPWLSSEKYSHKPSISLRSFSGAFLRIA